MEAAHAVPRPPPTRQVRQTATGNEERGDLAAMFYLAGGAVTAIAALDESADERLLVIAAVAVVIGALAVGLRRSFGYGPTVLASAAGTGLVAMGILLAGGGWGSATVASLTAFIAVHSALVLRRGHALALMGWVVAAVGSALVVLAPQLPWLLIGISFVIVYGTLLGVTQWLVGLARQQAAIDPETGLPSAASFAMALQRAGATVQRTDEPLSVVVLRVRPRRPSPGRWRPTPILEELTDGFCEQLRGRDVLARLDAERFAVALPGSDAAAAANVAARLVTVAQPVATCTVGVAGWDHRAPVLELVRQADPAHGPQPAIDGSPAGPA